MKFNGKQKRCFEYNIVYPQIIMESNDEILIDGVSKLLLCENNTVKFLSEVRIYPQKKSQKLLEITVNGVDMSLTYLKDMCVRINGTIISVSFSDG